MPAAFTVRLSDPRIDAPIERDCPNRVAANSVYRDLLATMWRRPSACLQIESNGEIIASFRHYNPERHHFNGLLMSQRRPS